MNGFIQKSDFTGKKWKINALWVIFLLYSLGRMSTMRSLTSRTKKSQVRTYIYWESLKNCHSNSNQQSILPPDGLNITFNFPINKVSMSRKGERDYYYKYNIIAEISLEHTCPVRASYFLAWCLIISLLLFKYTAYIESDILSLRKNCFQTVYIMGSGKKKYKDLTRVCFGYNIWRVTFKT